MNRAAVSTLPLLLFVVAFIPLTASRASASGILIDAFTTPQEIVVTGSVPASISNVVTGADILGGSRTMTVSTTSSGSPFTLEGEVRNNKAFLEGLLLGSMLLEWDANGAGLDLDLSDMMGLTIGRGTSDSGFLMTVRLLSLNGGMLVFNTSLEDWSGIGDPPPFPHNYHVGTYAFDRFQQIGQPNLQHVDAVQLELTRIGGVAGFIGDLSFAPQAVPDDTSTISLMLLGVLVVVLFQRRQVLGSILTRN